MVHFQGCAWCYQTDSFIPCYYWALNLCISGCLLKIKCFSIKGSEPTGMIQPTQGAIYFFSAPSVSLNCSSQSNPASGFNPNLTSVKGRDKKGYTLILVLKNPYSAAACFYKRVEGEACGVLIPAGIMAAQPLFAIRQHQPCIIPLYLHSVLYLQCCDDIEHIGSLLWPVSCILHPPARHLHHCSLLLGSPDCPEWKYQAVKYLLEFCAVISSPLPSHSYCNVQQDMS